MNDSTGNKIRPLYEELIGYLSGTPVPYTPYSKVSDESYWYLLDQSIEELNQITGKDYDKFRMKREPAADGRGGIIDLGAYRIKLNGLILRLHAEYYPKEPTPFVGTPPPTTIFSHEQSQAQSQEQSIRVMVFEVYDKIIEKLQDEEISQEERGFLEEVKEGLKDIRNVVGLINLILLTAREWGLAVDQLVNLIGNL